jgi:predicted metal-binding membrane protein
MARSAAPPSGRTVVIPPRDWLVTGSLAAMALVAWVALALWHASPYGRFLHHADTGAGLPLEAALFSVGWLLMVVAMMLPTSIPLVTTFAALVSRRPHPGRLVGLLLVGYLTVWSAFGLSVWLADRLVHLVVVSVPLLTSHPELITAGVLATAALWQLSPLKYRCLDECRSPLGFVLSRWQGERPGREALRLGVAHGAFCVGCCWSLMLVMFAVGLGSIVWMLVLGAVMAVEKNLPIGRRLTRPVAVGLVLAAVAALAW